MIIKNADQALLKFQKRFLFLAIVFYLINILNIFLAAAIIEESLGYSISFLVLFGIEKLITIFILYDGVQGKKTQLWLLDLFQLGFVYFFKYKGFSIQDYERVMVEVLGVRVIPILLTQLIFYFGCGFLQESKLSDYIIILSYVNFLALFLFAITIISLLAYNEQRRSLNKVFISCFITLGCYYLMIGSLSQFYDMSGMNLGYYAFILCSVNFVFYLIFSPPIQDLAIFLGETLFYIFSCCVTNNTLSYERVYAHSFSCSVQNSTIISYYSAIIKIGLLCTFSYKQVWETLTTESLYNASKMIVALNAILSVTLNIIYLIYFFKYILKQIVQLKKVVISKITDFDKAFIIMNKKHKYLKVLYICICIKQKRIDAIQRQLIIENFCSVECSKFFELYQSYSYCIKQGLQIEFQKETLQTCNCFLLKLAQEVEYLHSNLVRQITKLLEGQTNKQYFFFWILFLRQMNGLGETTFSQQLKNYHHQSAIQVQRKIQKLQSEFLQVFAFLNNYQGYMVYFSSRILYDLYE
ncbi:hypothetical protein ABPG74_011220 [Tetrahymena malaccensis]